jgi:hypothetical protein
MPNVAPVTSRATQAAGATVEKFAGTAGRWFGWFTLAFCVVLVAIASTRDLIVEIDTFAFAGLVASMTWIVLVRPTVEAHANGVLLRNMLRDTFVPWSRIERCRVLQTLQIVTEEGDRFHGVGVVRSTRSVLKARRRQAMPTASPTSMGQFGRSWLPGAGPDKVAGHSSYAQQAQSDLSYHDYIERQIESAVDKSADDGLEPIVSWAPAAVAALAFAVFCLVVMIV